MPQLIRTTNDVIVNSLYLIGELGVGETPDAFMLSTGLELLNDLLDKFSVDSIYIPYLTTLNFPFEVGKDIYTVSDMKPSDITADQIIDLSFANYTVVVTGGSEPIVYDLMIITKSQYWDTVRLSNLRARPGFIFLNKQPLQSSVTVYPVPDQPYLCTIQCKLMLNYVQQQDNLSFVPPYYYGFLKLALARAFLAYYPSANWPQTNEDEYQDRYNALKIANETDVTIRPSVILDAPQPFYWPNIIAYG